MKKDLVVPSVGESVTEVTILKWLKNSGELVKPGEAVLEIESDKATVEIAADIAGVVYAARPAGERVKIGDVVGIIDSDAKPSAQPSRPATPPPAPTQVFTSSTPMFQPGPAAVKLATEQGIDWTQTRGSGKDGRLTKGDILTGTHSGTGATAGGPAILSGQAAPATKSTPAGAKRVAMSSLRAKIAERLVHAQHSAAILTTFNECDMSAVNRIRAQHKESFKSKHGVSLGFMSFFTKACAQALRELPVVNSQIDGHDILQFETQDIGVAVGTDRGLVVPVLRNAGAMSFVDIEKGISALAEKAKVGRLSIADMSGGTFTISNGGTYGSLMSTPILNPPQSAILGMHKIQDRPMAINGKVEVRPMMYLALSYDHRLIDGKEAVTFLIKVKEGIENPEKLGLDFIQ